MKVIDFMNIRVLMKVRDIVAYEFCVSNLRHFPTLINLTMYQAHTAVSFGTAKLLMQVTQLAAIE